MPDSSVAALLRVAGDGAGGQILVTLGKGGLRTGSLADRIQPFSPRSVYRYIRTLEERGLVDRLEEVGVPSTVRLSLSDPSGRAFVRLLRTFAATPLAGLPSGGRDFESWASLSQLGAVWEAGFIDELSHGSRSLTQLAMSAPTMTYHQVNRGVQLYVANRLLIRTPMDRLRLYELTDHGRRRMALIAGVGRWRHRYIDDGLPGLTTAEMITVLRTALPLILLPEFAGLSIDFGVSGPMDADGCREKEILQGVIASSGKMHFERVASPASGGSATGTLNTWFAALLDGNRGRMQVGGNLPLVDACLTRIYDVLWEKGVTPIRATLPSSDTADG